MAEKLTLEKLVELGNIPSSTLQESAKGSIIYDDFKGEPLCAAPEGAGAATGTGGDENILSTGKNNYRYHMMGTQSTVGFAPNAKGLDITLDDTNNDGVEIVPSLVSHSNGYMTVGTDAAFFMRCKINVTTPDEISPLLIGFRKAEAFQEAFDNYDEMAAIGVLGDTTNANVTIHTIINNATTVATNTTQDMAAATDTEFYVEVSAAGVVTFKWGAAGLAAPTTTYAFTFDDGEKVIPFIHYLHHTNTADGVYLKELEVGYVSEQV